MASFYAFEAVFGDRQDLAYDNRTAEHVLRNRRALENELFFDRLLQALGLAKGMTTWIANKRMRGVCVSEVRKALCSSVSRFDRLAYLVTF